MKAAVVERPGELVVREIPEPEPGPYDALVEILYGGICTGTDQHIVANEFPWPIRYPTVLGHESIGRVVSTGPKVRWFQPGDLVTRVGTLASDGLSVTWGGFAQRGIARDWLAMETDGVDPSQWREHRRTLKLPAGADPASATMLITWRETFSHSRRMGIGPGAAVLIVGTGGNGLAFVAHARNLGATTITVVGAPDREAVARQAGATHFHNYRDENLVEPVRADCPAGYDFAIDAVGKVGQLDLCVACLRPGHPGGMVAMYGIDDLGQATINPQKTRGSFIFFKGGYDEAEVHDEVVALWQAGRLDASLWMDLEHPIPLDDINQAFDQLRARKQVKGLIRIQG